MTAACSSGTTTGEPTASSGSASIANSPAFPSESVPPGVEKDSVLDLNSTKDMTGVVTTVTFADSPYAAHLPDICTLIPEAVMRSLGVSNKIRGFRGTQLISQACVMQQIDSGNLISSTTINLYVNNLSEILAPDKAVTLRRDVKIGDRLVGIVNKLPMTGADDATFREECGTAWGTFFGAIVVRYRTETPDAVDPCAHSIDAARVVAPYMPKSPSQMRPAP